MKRFIAYIFLFIFSFQILPVKEIGKILYKGLMTEERNETCCEDECEGTCIPKLKKEADPYHNEPAHSLFDRYTGKRILTAIHTTEQIPAYHVPDIFTPPPNFAHI